MPSDQHRQSPGKSLRSRIFSGFLLFILAAAAPLPVTKAAENPWRDVELTQPAIQDENRTLPQRYRLLQLDLSSLEERLRGAPASAMSDPSLGPVVEIPLPNGGFQKFYVSRGQVMAPELAAKYPEIVTYQGTAVDNPGIWGRFDITPKGFHGFIRHGSSTIYIDPHSSQSDGNFYINYFQREFLRPADQLPVNPTDYYSPEPLSSTLATSIPLSSISSGDQLKTYRLVVAATGEYTAFHGGTVVDALAEVVTAINRVTGIYEHDLTVRLELVANNDQVIYTDANSDPYTNSSPGALLSENQSNLDSVIGSANYDIGHVFSTGGGGLAGLGVVCNNSSKAHGETGLTNPTGDPFWVDYVAHEIGHQFGGNHTFNGTASACSGGNRNGSTAYEPGSGTTIMAYAGICGSQNIQSNSDPHFHAGSIAEIRNFVTGGSGQLCGTTSSTGNNPPQADAGVGGFSIPINTPFSLTGSGSDIDGDNVIYKWEQMDTGPGGAPDSPSGNAPLFRSFTASDNPTRYFPQLSDLLNNTHTLGETLPSYTRALSFRLTVHDQRSGGGGTSYDDISFNVTDSAGPFQITSPNGGETLNGGSNVTVNWDVAGTNTNPVNCSQVDLLLSTDGGNNFSQTLVSGSANDGSQGVILPNQDIPNARILVACSNNVFFDISDADSVINAVGSGFNISVTPQDKTVCSGNVAQFGVSVGQIGSFNSPVTLSSNNAPGSIGFSVNPVTPPGSSTLNLSGVGNGIYVFTVSATSGAETKTSPSLTLNVVDAPLAPTLVSPANGALGMSTAPTFSWSGSASGYRFEIDDNSDFSSPLYAIDISNTSYTPPSSLDNSVRYYWRVRSTNNCGNSSFVTRSFQTIPPAYTWSLVSQDVPKSIPSSGSNVSISSTLTVATDAIISDLNLSDLAGTHTWVGDLEFILKSPQGTEVTVVNMDTNCNQDNFALNLDDEAAGSAGGWPCPPTGNGTYRPSNPLSGFDGENAKGTWTLIINDRYGAADGGSLTSWGLEIGVVDECIGSDIALSNKTLSSGEQFNCLAENQITVSNNFNVNNGATIRLQAPLILLQPGVTIQGSGQLSAP